MRPSNDKPCVLCTIGPASQSEDVLRQFERLGVDLLRINLSHTALEDVESTINRIRRTTSIPICIDTEGAQIRTGRMKAGRLDVLAGEKITLGPADQPGGDGYIPLTPSSCIGALRSGDVVALDFGTALVEVTVPEGDLARAKVISSGRVGTHKAVSVQREIALPGITEKDRAAIAISRRLGLRHFALSFAQNETTVREIRSLAGSDSFVISKIESISGLQHLDQIAVASDALLIDRGDLSRQVPIQQVPHCQKHIIARAKMLGREVYVATNLLESMITASFPTRAEVSDIYNTLLDGADGLVLAAETAIGAFPAGCVAVARSMIDCFAARRGMASDRLQRVQWEQAEWPRINGVPQPPWLVGIED